MQQESQVTLHSVLQKLSRQLTANYQAAKMELLVELLTCIDKKFKQLTPPISYENLLISVTEYYSEHLNESVKRAFILRSGYVDKFTHIFQLVLDLAFNRNEEQKNRFLQEILNMSEKEKELLMPYVEEVMNRKFIILNQAGDANEEEIIEMKEQEYQQLSELYEELKCIYSELAANHSSLKESHEKLTHEYHSLVEEREKFLFEVGTDVTTRLSEVAEKYKHDQTEYETYIDKISKELEDKKTGLKARDQQISQLSCTVREEGEATSQVTILELKVRELSHSLSDEVHKLIQLEKKFEQSQSLLRQKCDELQAKNMEIQQLNDIKLKYELVKRVHCSFKKNVMKMRDN